jgi:DHA1 family bicyclomycin/chloramphenicol resistance-like MFS transporter
MTFAEPPPRSGAAVNVLLTALVAFQAISTDLYLASLPTMQRVFATDEARVQLTLSVFLFGSAVMQLAYGPISDRFGRRPVLRFAIALYVAASLACALAPTIEALIVFRLLQAIGSCAGVTLGRAVARDLYAPVVAARVLAYMASAMAIAPIIGPMLGS